MLPEGKEVRVYAQPLCSPAAGVQGDLTSTFLEPFIIYYREASYPQQGYGEPKYGSSDKGLKLLSQQHSTRWKDTRVCFV